MPRRAVITETMTGVLSKETRDARMAVEAEWRRGNLADYEPMCLNDEGMIVFNAIANALPENALAEVDGFTIEVAADAYAQMVDARRHVIAEGQVVERETRAGVHEAANPWTQTYARYAEIFKRYMVELGVTPSARAKIAADAAKQLTRPQGVRSKLQNG